jgi:hypothetical protein
MFKTKKKWPSEQKKIVCMNNEIGGDTCKVKVICEQHISFLIPSATAGGPKEPLKNTNNG